MMKRLSLMLLLCAAVSAVCAQKITHEFRNVSMSDALKYIQLQTTHYDLIFIYDDLEDFRVSTSIRNKSVPDAIQQLVGFYPVRVSKHGEHEIYVECTHKTAHRLTGNIVDEQGQPVAYANVYLLHPSDSTVIGGGVSNEAGLFVIPCDEKHVLLRISYIGYKTVYRQCKDTELGTIRMQPDSYRLNGIEVKGSRPLVRIKDDAFVTTVEGSYLSKMGTASEVLNHVPGVLSNGGNVEVLRRGTPIIYINGRQIRNQSELGQLNSDQIKDVEVVMTPGAKYDASVRSVIRIKTITVVCPFSTFYEIKPVCDTCYFVGIFPTEYIDHVDYIIEAPDGDVFDRPITHYVNKLKVDTTVVLTTIDHYEHPALTLYQVQTKHE